MTVTPLQTAEWIFLPLLLWFDLNEIPEVVCEVFVRDHKVVRADLNI